MKPSKKSHAKIGIKWRIFAYFLLFTAIIITVLWLTQSVFLRDIYKSIKTAEIRSTAHKLTKAIDNDDLSDEAERIGEESRTCILILKMQNDNFAIRIASVDAQPHCVIHNMTRDGVFTLYDEAAENGGSLLERYRYDAASHSFGKITDSGHFSDMEESIIYTIITTDSSGNDVLVILNSVISPLSSTVKTLNYLLVAISVLVVILAMIIAAVISKVISEPIVKINNSAKKLARADYDTKFEGGSYKEITELADTLNYAASELSKVDSLRRELIANISHDLRTPLTMISGYSEIMRDIPGENTSDNINVIIDESHRLTSLVNDMLDISKIESGNMSVNASRFNLTESIRNEMHRYSKFRERDGYLISFDYDCEIFVTSDETRFLQAFCNLVNNAITYTGDDKKVTVTQTIRSRENGVGIVRISVADTGEGIEADKLPLIWDRYYKVDKAHRRASQGSGLGLSIVSKIMTMLDGSCGVTSTPGIGSVFYIEIPYDRIEAESEDL